MFHHRCRHVWFGGETWSVLYVEFVSYGKLEYAVLRFLFVHEISHPEIVSAVYYKIPEFVRQSYRNGQIYRSCPGHVASALIP